LTQKLNEALFKLEKQTHEHREEVMNFETFQATNQSLTTELTEAKAKLFFFFGLSLFLKASCNFFFIFFLDSH